MICTYLHDVQEGVAALQRYKLRKARETARRIQCQVRLTEIHREIKNEPDCFRSTIIGRGTMSPFELIQLTYDGDWYDHETQRDE